MPDEGSARRNILKLGTEGEKSWRTAAGSHNRSGYRLNVTSIDEPETRDGSGDVIQQNVVGLSDSSCSFAFTQYLNVLSLNCSPQVNHGARYPSSQQLNYSAWLLVERVRLSAAVSLH